MFEENFQDKKLEQFAIKYVSDALKYYEHGDFTIFRQNGKVYAGIRKQVADLEGQGLVRIIKIGKPVESNIRDLLTKMANPPQILDVDNSIELFNRGCFYACFEKNVLKRLTINQQRYLTDNELF